ncbi:MAG: hypothetical protein JWN62_1748 [Acidimicrobiales bacterium]|nr:hypothetical protein [Acidimicrobiales bacterium]
MYRFLLRPKWILFHIVVLASSVGMLGLARWQWNRHIERDAFVAKVEQREQAEPVELTLVLGTKPVSDIEYSRVTASGHYLADQQFVEILQTVNGFNGENVLTPLQIDGGPILIVNRGFIADGQPVPAPPSGTLIVGGLARTSQIRQTGQLTDNSDGAKLDEVRRVDLDLISERLGSAVAPVYIDLIKTVPPSPTPPDPTGLPDLSGGPPHVSYTIQWCIFSVCAVVGWVLAVRRSRRTRQRDADKAEKATTAAAPAEPVSAERPMQPSA